MKAHVSDHAIERVVRESRKRKLLRRGTALLCALVTMLTMISLEDAVQAMTGDDLCAIPAHTHTEACFKPELICGLEEAEEVTETVRAFLPFTAHRHTEACLDEDGNIACGWVEDMYYHTHNDFCYDEDGRLACGLEEKKEHVHTDACYAEARTLICALEEDEGHQHTEECYQESALLTCGLEETEGHLHTSACTARTLTCGLDENEAHTHGDACYTEAFICGLIEGEGAHVHGEDCYTTVRELICALPEREGHAHTDDCFEITQTLTCGQDMALNTAEKMGLDSVELHRHDEKKCFVTVTRRINGEEMECALAICGCMQVPEFVSGPESWTEKTVVISAGHTHIDDCWKIPEEPICGLQEHAHTLACLWSNDPQTGENAAYVALTAEPTEVPTEEPTAEPTEVPTEEPSTEPTEDPTAEPTEEPTAEPTEEATAVPAAVPTEEPTEEPTAEPTPVPTEAPAEGVLALPGLGKTVYYSDLARASLVDLALIRSISASDPQAVTVEPISLLLLIRDYAITANAYFERVTLTVTLYGGETLDLTLTNPAPTATAKPTAEPTSEPTAEPTIEPTAEPTEEPSAAPTAEPTEEPTAEPTPVTLRAEGGASIALSADAELPEDIAFTVTPISAPEGAEEELQAAFGAETECTAAWYEISLGDVHEISASIKLPGIIPQEALQAPEIEGLMGHAHVRAVVLHQLPDGELVSLAGVNVEGTDITFTTDGLSPFGLAYTVDFYYESEEYHLTGGESLRLSELLALLGIDLDISAVTDVTFSDPALIEITPLDDDWQI